MMWSGSNTMGRSQRAVAMTLPVSRAESEKDSRTARRRRTSTFQPRACRRRKRRAEPAVVAAVVAAARPREAEAARRTDRPRGPRRRQAYRSRRRARELFAKSRKIVANSLCALCSLFSLSLVAATTAHRRTRPRKKAAVPIEREKSAALSEQRRCCSALHWAFRANRSKSGAKARGVGESQEITMLQTQPCRRAQRGLLILADALHST